ncbi:MAG: hypothetical protein JHC98_00070 [Thermoleophilaceae bacterium]|nr:hypothetical protein [Thermoleophilaceae bacterium]
MAYKYSRDRRELGAYHVYNRAIDGTRLFGDDEDRRVFAGMTQRHLTAVPEKDRRGRPYRSLRDEVRMNARCLLTSLFHLVLWQRVAGGIDRLMRRVLGAYVRYFHKKYGGSGPMFAGEFRARRIDGPNSFKWRIGYVHDNHERLGLDYEFSTHGLYLSPNEAPTWLDVGSTLKIFGGLPAYLDYMKQRAERARLDQELRRDQRL